jgi:type II secretory pathway predicted ATPase ExeA
MRRPSNLMKAVTAPRPAQLVADPSPPLNYLDLYGLSKPPFGGAPEAGGYILFGAHRRAFELLIDHMMNGSGVVLLIGESGIGKTEMLRSAAAVVAESGLQAVMLSRPSEARISLEQLTSALGGQPEDFHQSPRKALLADDFDLMPNDCISLLLSLARDKPESAGGNAIVLSSSSTALSRPDLAELAGLARNTIRLLPLGPAEIRQYIERSLWVAGGTTRRLITPEAIRLITARSDGVPGTVNRVMEATLTAGFARGDVIITAKTVESVIGPPAPRQRHEARPLPVEWSGGTGRRLEMIAGGLFAIGMVVFLYKGLTGPPERPSPPASRPADIVAPPAVQPPPAAKAPERLSPALVATLMKRGNEALDLGDIAAARLLFQRAAEAGDAAAATALGKTYDPNFTTVASARDPARAVEWYETAAALGDSSATGLLKRLSPR